MTFRDDLRFKVLGLARDTGLATPELSRLVIEILAARSVSRRRLDDANQGELLGLLKAIDHAPGDRDVDPFSTLRRIATLPTYLRDQVQFFVDELQGHEREPQRSLDLCVDLIRLGDTRRDNGVYDSELAALLVQSLSPRSGETAYCAFAGAAEPAFRLALGGVRARLDIDDQALAETWAAVAVATGLRVDVSYTRPFEAFAQQWPVNVETFDIAIVVPPFGIKLDHLYKVGMGLGGPTSEAWGLMLTSVRGRRGAAVVPNSLIFRTTAAEQSFKEKLIRAFSLRAVVALRSGLLLPFTNISSSLVAFNREEARDDQVLIINPDAEGRNLAPSAEAIAKLLADPHDSTWSRLVSTTELRENDYNMSPDRYVLTGKARAANAIRRQGSALGDLVEIIRPQNVGFAQNEIGPGAPILELGVADIGDFGLVTCISKAPGSPQDHHKAERAKLRPNDIVLVVKGSVGKVGFFEGDRTGLDVIASQSFVILRCRSDGPIKDAAVLFRFLSSDTGRTILDSLKTGSAVPTLQVADIRTFPVLIPTPATQDLIAQQMRGLFELQRDLEKQRSAGMHQRAEMWPDRPGDIDTR